VEQFRGREAGFFDNDALSGVERAKLEAIGKKVLVLTSGTTLLGRSPKRRGVGSVATTAESKRAVRG
jgi:hypothetical protein